MTSLTIAVSTDEVARRLRDRLRGGNRGGPVVWQQEGDRVLLFADQLTARSVGGWLVCNLDAQADETGRQTLQFLYYLGKRGEGDGVKAAATISVATTPQAQLADRWGRDIQRVLWDGVLDVVEAAVAEGRGPQVQPVQITGFHVDAAAVHVDILAGRG